MAIPLALLAKQAAQKAGKNFAKNMAKKTASKAITGSNKDDPEDPLAKKKKSPIIMGAIVLGGMAAAPIAGSELDGTFTHNVVDKLAEEPAEKDINDLGTKYDETDPSEMYKAGAYILREMVERAYKKTQILNEEEIKKYADEIGTYKNRKSRYADVFMPVESREKYTNNANAPRVDISYILAAYNVSMADMVPKHGYLLDLKSKVFKTELYKDMYSYRSTLKSRDKVEYEYKTHRDSKGKTWVETIEHKYKEYWTESELDPFDDSIVLAHLFNESPYYKIEKVMFDQAPENKNGFKKASKDWESAKKKQEQALNEKIKNISGKTLMEDEDIVRQREEQMKAKYLAKRFVEFVYRQPYYGSHVEYEYEDSSSFPTLEKKSIYGYKNKSFFYNKNPMQKYVRNNYYDTQQMDNGQYDYKSKALLQMNKKDGFWNKAKGIFEKGKASFDSLFGINNDVYKNSQFERRKMGNEGSMDIDEEGNVIEKARKKNDGKIKFKEAGDLTTSKESKQGYWSDLDDQDDEIDITGTHLDTEANKTGKPSVKYDDYKKENPDLIAWHEKIRKNTIKNKDKVVKGEYYKGLPIIDGMGSSLIEFEREKKAEFQSSSESKRKNISSKNRKDAYSLEKDLEKLDEKRQEEQSKNQSNNSSSSSVDAINGSSSSNKGQQVVDMAAKYIGGKYVWGGNSLTGGIDCSGFTCQIYKRFGVNLPRKSDAQISAGRKVSSLSEAKPGDLLVFRGHVGIYAGNGYMIHASSPSTGIIKTKVTYGGHRIVGIRRLVNDPLPNVPPPFTGDPEIGRSQWHGITAEQLERYFGGSLKGTGKYFIKYGNEYGVNPAILAAISMNETGNGTSRLSRNNNNFFGMRRGGWLRFESKEKGIEAGIRNIGLNFVGKGLNNFSKMVNKYAEGSSLWVHSNDYFLKKITGKTQYQIDFGKGQSGGSASGVADGGITEDDSESTASPSQGDNSTALGSMFNGQSSITQKMIEEDGRGLIVAQFDVDLNNKTDGPTNYDKMYAPVNVRQKIMQFQTSMYNSIEPPPGLDPKSADEEHRHSKYYNYTKELEDRIWGGFRRDNHNFLILFNFETKKDLKGEGLDLDIMNKIFESGEARAFGFGFGQGGGGGVAAIAEKAKSHLGEGPGPTQSWFGMNDYWCAMFVSRVMHEAGVPKNVWKKTAGTREALPFAKKNGWFRKPGEYKPSPGDPIWFFFGRVSPCDHIGVVEKVEGDTVVTIEGNSNNMVKRNKYKLTDPHIVGYMDIATAAGGGSGSKVASLGGSTVGSQISNEGGTGEITSTQTGEGIENKTTASTEDLLDLTGSSLHSMSGYLQGDDVDKAYKYLRSRGYSAPAASAVLASMVLKSGGDFNRKDGKLSFKNIDRGKNESNDKNIAKKQEELVKLLEDNKKSKEYKSTKNNAKIEKLTKEIEKLEKTSSGIGILNWQGERAIGQYGLKDFAKRYGRDWKTIEAQVGFLDWELTHTFTENFKDAPRPDYRTLGYVKHLGYKSDKASVSAYNNALKKKEKIIKKYTGDYSVDKINDEKIKDKYTKEVISQGLGWGKDLIDFKRIGIKLNLQTVFGQSPELNEASDVMYYCYLYPDGKNKSGQEKMRQLTKDIFKEFALNRELNLSGKDEYKDYIARRNKTSVKESYLLLPDNSRGQGSGDSQDSQGGEIMEFKGAICTGFNDSQLAIGPAQGKNAVAAHNMPYGTIVEIPQLKGKMGGGTFRSSKGKTYDLGPINNGRFIVADTGGPFFDFDIWGFSGGKVNMDVKVISWGEGEGMAWSITEAIQDAQRRGTWGKYQKAFNNSNNNYGGFKTKKLSKFKNNDLNNPLIK